MTLLVDKSVFEWPKELTLAPYQDLKVFQVRKVAAVGLACLMVFGIQARCSWPMSAGIGLISSAITLYSETFLRMNDDQNPDWDNPCIDRKFVWIWVASRLSFVPVITCGITLLSFAPMQTITLKLMNGHLKTLLLVSLIAPIGEEILFRGFIQERLEDLASFIDRSFYPLSETAKKRFSILLQSLFFGAIHITGSQCTSRIAKTAVFCMTSFMARFLTLVKNKDRSLLSPIICHAFQNIGISIGLRAAGLLKEPFR